MSDALRTLLSEGLDLCVRARKLDEAARDLAEWQLVNNVLADACAVAGSQKAWASENGISQQFVCDVLQGRHAPTDRLARALGYRRVVSFERIKG